MRYDMYLLLKKNEAAASSRVLKAQKDAFAKYHIPKPANEPHDLKCQVARYGAKYCCTCESNMTRREQAIAAAAHANDRIVLDSLGSMEQYRWHEARKEVDPTHKNPYKDR